MGITVITPTKITVNTTGVAEAPSNDILYGRKNGAWEEITEQDVSVDVIFVNYLNVDKTGATDASALINAAILAATGDHISIFFGQSELKLSSQISIFDKKKSISIYSQNCVLKPTFEDDLDLFKLGSNSAQSEKIYPNSVELYGLRINLEDTDTTSAVSALNIDTVLGSPVIKNCHFYNFQRYDTVGIKLLNIGNNPTQAKNNSEPGFSASQCYFYNTSNTEAATYDYANNNTRGIGFQIGETNDNASEYWTITNCHFSNVHKGIRVLSGANGTITGGCTFQYCNPIESGQTIEAGIIEINASTDNDGKISITNCKFNHNWGTAIYGTYTSDERPCRISNCEFLANSYLPIKFNGSNRVKTQLCTFDRASSATGLNKPAFTVDRYIILLNSNSCAIQNNDFVSGADYAIAFSSGSKDNIITGNTYSEDITPDAGVTDGLVLNVSDGVNNCIVANNVKTT